MEELRNEITITQKKGLPFIVASIIIWVLITIVSTLDINIDTKNLYDNETAVRDMVAQQADMKIPTGLIPHCPVCGKPMTMNLRADDTFVQDDGWYRASERYSDFLRRHEGAKVLFLELGVGMNTPGIVKFSFWQMTQQNLKAAYVCINKGEAYAPKEIMGRSICINADIRKVLEQL